MVLVLLKQIKSFRLLFFMRVSSAVTVKCHYSLLTETINVIIHLRGQVITLRVAILRPHPYLLGRMGSGTIHM